MAYRCVRHVTELSSVCSNPDPAINRHPGADVQDVSVHRCDTQSEVIHSQR